MSLSAGKLQRPVPPIFLKQNAVRVRGRDVQSSGILSLLNQ